MSARLSSPGRRVVRHVEMVWGTAVVIDVRDCDDSWPSPDVVDAAIDAALRELHWVDEVFSTFRHDSEVCRLRRGELSIATLNLGDTRQAALAEVIVRCRDAERLTGGAFSSRPTDDGFDPTGLVKGWAMQRVADLIVDAGLSHVCVNAGGDVVTRGSSAPGVAWRIGIRHPDLEGELAASVEVGDRVVATSALYERGDHVRDPVTGSPARGARSATVVGTDGALADALATGLLVAGRHGAGWFDRLPGWSAFVVDPGDSPTAWTIGDDIDAGVAR